MNYRLKHFTTFWTFKFNYLLTSNLPSDVLKFSITTSSSNTFGNIVFLNQAATREFRRLKVKLLEHFLHPRLKGNNYKLFSVSRKQKRQIRFLLKRIFSPQQKSNETGNKSKTRTTKAAYNSTFHKPPLPEGLV